MNTSYAVTTAAGELIATIAADGNHWATIKALVAANPGAEVKSVATIANPCSEHPSYQADNCPACGTSRMSA